jgi:hypothetical protein
LELNLDSSINNVKAAINPRLFDRRMALLLLALSLPLLFLPKINLLSFSGQTAGIRIDDFALIIFGGLYFCGSFSWKRSLQPIEITVAAIIAFSFCSYLINKLHVESGYLHVQASLFYVFRFLEYFFFYYVGTLAVRYVSLGTILRVFVVWNLLFMVLQGTHLIGIFSSVEGYVSQTVDNRLFGIASFGAEIGALLDMLFCYFIFENYSKSTKIELVPHQMMGVLQRQKHHWLLIIFGAVIIFSGARIAILALLVVYFIRVGQLFRIRKPSTWMVPFLAVGLASGIMILLISFQTGMVTRSEGLLSTTNLELIPTAWVNINMDYDPIGKETIDFDDYDLSWWMRIHKWVYALKIYWLHPQCWLQGIGPGFAMAALDGGLLRILTELGIIGILLYGCLTWQIAKLSPMLKWMMVVFALNMLFFDLYLAYKPMALLFLMVGYTSSNRSFQS